MKKLLVMLLACMALGCQSNDPEAVALRKAQNAQKEFDRASRQAEKRMEQAQSRAEKQTNHESQSEKAQVRTQRDMEKRNARAENAIQQDQPLDSQPTDSPE